MWSKPNEAVSSSKDDAVTLPTSIIIDDEKEFVDGEDFLLFPNDL